MGDLKISKKYINAIKKIYSELNNVNNEAKLIEDSINDETNKLTLFMEEVKLLNEKDAETIMPEVEEKAVEFDKILASLTQKIEPLTLKYHEIKKDISNLYQKIILEYSDYKEEDIIEAIKKEL